MNFEVKQRDGPARIGELAVDHKNVITPNILFVHTSRFKAPAFADMVITHDHRDTEKPALRVLGTMFSPVREKKQEELAISNYLLYPKDTVKEAHVFAIKANRKRRAKCYVLPGNKEIIDDALQGNDASLFIVANAGQLFSQPSEFVDFMTRLRDKMGYQKMLYLPCVGDPTNFAFLTYMGIDFFDSIAASIAARNNILLFPTGNHNKNEVREIPCSCPSCNKMKDTPSKMTFAQILHHNYFALVTEVKTVRNAIALGNLRELVETRVRTNPALTAMLRTLDRKHYAFLEERTPVTRKTRLLATTKEALFRPEIQRFQERVITRYKKPKSTKLLVLLPCSAKKPYSFSKSHKLFRERTHGVNNPTVVHEVIVTSPLGIVPRELELVYPASSYDIPVTGIWDEDEKKMIRTLLQHYLESNKYDTVITHLPPVMQDFINDLVETPLITCTTNPTSNEALNQLSDVLEQTGARYERVPASLRAKENVDSLASFQFGRKPAEKLLKDCQIRGRYPYQKIISEKKQLGMIIWERGLISLTMHGAERLQEAEIYWVEMYDDFTLKGSLFAPGVKDADERIRVGDEVVVRTNQRLCGVGVAQMNGKEMKEATRGEAVKIRHYR